jgi:uncharacterized protein YbaR (Trm112 family)/2-polyprenyl-3-methyl-5-hydroxy-6-metoxy-1,4-benzoquinol methylase
MRPEYLDYLVCPACQGTLELHAFRALAPSDDTVESGLLRCRECGHPYPIDEAIPRMLPNALVIRPEFGQMFAAELAEIDFELPSQEKVRSFEKLHRLTSRAFGYEWNTYRTTSWEEDVFTLFWLTGIDPKIYEKFPIQDVFTFYPSASDIEKLDGSALEGATVAEVGCGMGKYVRVVSERAKMVIGLDLSDALHRARSHTGDRSNVFLVQGNILEPPLRAEFLDFVYSVGVLHHTPDCHQAFVNSASFVKPEGRLAVWLYPTDLNKSRYADRVHWMQDALLRPMTSRMPPGLLRVFCGVLGRLTFARDWFSEYHAKTGSRLAYYMAASTGAVVVGQHKDPEIAAFLNFDWYSPQYRSYHSEEELKGWYEAVGFSEVRELPQRVSGIGTRKPR